MMVFNHLSLVLVCIKFSLLHLYLNLLDLSFVVRCLLFEHHLTILKFSIQSLEFYLQLFVCLILACINLLHMHDVVFKLLNVALENRNLVALCVLLLIDYFLCRSQLSCEIENLKLERLMLSLHFFVCLGNCVLQSFDLLIFQVAHVAEVWIELYLLCF